MKIIYGSSYIDKLKFKYDLILLLVPHKYFIEKGAKKIKRLLKKEVFCLIISLFFLKINLINLMNIILINFAFAFLICLIVINLSQKYKFFLDQRHRNIQKIHKDFIPRLEE